MLTSSYFLFTSRRHGITKVMEFPHITTRTRGRRAITVVMESRWVESQRHLANTMVSSAAHDIVATLAFHPVLPETVERTKLRMPPIDSPSQAAYSKVSLNTGTSKRVKKIMVIGGIRTPYHRI